MNTKIKHFTGDEFINVCGNINTDNFKYFYPRTDFTEINNVDFFVIYSNSNDNEVVGIAHIRKNPYINNTHWLSYLSISPDYQNLGYASKLSEYIIKWFKQKDLQFETSSYSKQGFVKLKPLFNKLTNKYNVDFLDKETLI